MFDLTTLREFLRFLSIPFVNLNFIDIAIVFVLVLYAIEGYAVGFIRATADFVTFVISFAFALTFYDVFGDFLVSTFQIPRGFGNALGFFVAAFLCEIFLSIVLRNYILPSLIAKSKEIDILERVERYGGIIPGVLSAVVLLAFVLTIIVALPLSPFLKNSVSSSRLGGIIVSNIQGLDKQLGNVFGGAVTDALTFFTIEPKSEEILKLNFSTANFSVDEASEKEMLALVNVEREKVGLKPLQASQALTVTGRKHCMDMFTRGYFSHYTPEGKSPFDRMAEDNITFNYAGENLALAPSTKLAMQGLMNSPGHKANILSKNFGKLGTGVMDGGIYGEMFCQEFTD